MLENLREDVRAVGRGYRRGFPWYLLEALLLDNGFQAVVLYRLAHYFRSRGIPLLGPLVARLCLFLTGVDIAPSAQIGPGLRISHGVGVVVGGGARIGARALLMHDVTIGAPRPERIGEMPQIGDDVFLGAGARIIGPVRIGDNVFVGVHAIVTEDVADGCRALAPQGARIVRPGASAVSSAGQARGEAAPPGG